MRLTGCGIVLVLLTAVSASTLAQEALPQAPGVHKLATTLRGSSCSAAGIEPGDPAKGPSIIVEKFAPGCAIPWHWHTPNEHVMMVSGTLRFEIQGEKSVEVNAGDFALSPLITSVRRRALDAIPASFSLYRCAGRHAFRRRDRSGNLFGPSAQELREPAP